MAVVFCHGSRPAPCRSHGSPSASAALADCQAQIEQVLATITARNLSTLQGPPLSSFLRLNPSALEQAAALDRARAGGRPAGAIMVDKTNMDAFAFGIRGLSGSGGRVGNAYDPSLSSGGSSAGLGVAVGVGFVPLALGSDNCGSLRIPAVYNGAASLRPTLNRFDATGLFPIGFLNGTPGLIARDVPLLEQGLAVLADDWRSPLATASGALAGRPVGVLVAAGPSPPPR